MADRLSWAVERVVPDQTTNTPAGDTVVGSYVYYVTGDGNHGVVFISNDKFNKDHVTTAVRRDARRLDEIAALTEGNLQGG